MRKILLTVMMVSSLLAFNACTKDGAQGPAGPTGNAGPAGAVGPAGAKGADGTTIRSGDAAPTASAGVDGDYYFDKTAKILYGPKAAGAWPAGTSLAGAAGAKGDKGDTGAKGDKGDTGAKGDKGDKGDTGAAGAAGASFTAGTDASGPLGVPGAGTGKVGDYYFNTNTSTFYGPKGTGTTPWAGANVLPLGSVYATKVYLYNAGFINVAQVTKTFGEKVDETYSPYDLKSSYKVTAEDVHRQQFYANWSVNREMIFETVPNSGVFDAVPQSATELGNGAGALYPVGSTFKYTGNKANPNITFTLTQEDVNRLQDQNGSAFGYLTYAKADPTKMALGDYLYFAEIKNVNVSNSTDYNATYTAQTKINLNTIAPDLEKYKQEGGIVLVRYRLVNPDGSLQNSGSESGWGDLTTYAKSYVKAGTYATGIVTAINNITNPLAAAIPGTFTYATNQVLTAAAAVAGDFSNGDLTYRWTIASGTNLPGATTQYKVTPQTLTNPGGLLQGLVFTNPFVDRTFETKYYSAGQLVTNRTIVGGAISYIPRTGGQPASYFADKSFIRVQITLVPAVVATAAQAKGINVNDADALLKFAESTR